ncbi:MAG: LysR substrate-binding domain-containing protein [Paraglaciecola chathamensis]
MRKLPPLNALRYFSVAAQTLSFKEAADQLFVTQAAISQHIKTLEAFLGCQLFIRGHRSVSLTQAGQRLAPYVASGFTSFLNGVDSVAADDQPNSLTITATESLSIRWLVPRLSKFQTLQPDMNVKIQPTNTLLDFEANDIDVAIRFGTGDYPNLESQKLLEDTLYLVCHPGLKEKALTPEHLVNLPTLKEQSSDIMLAWNKFYEMHNLPLGQGLTSLQEDDSSATIIEAALAGQGFAMIRNSLIYEQLEKGQLVRLFDFNFPCQYAYYLVAPPSHFSRIKVQHFSRWVVEQFDQITKQH